MLFFPPLFRSLFCLHLSVFQSMSVFLSPLLFNSPTLSLPLDPSPPLSISPLLAITSSVSWKTNPSSSHPGCQVTSFPVLTVRSAMFTDVLAPSIIHESVTGARCVRSQSDSSICPGQLFPPLRLRLLSFLSSPFILFVYLHSFHFQCTLGS